MMFYYRPTIDDLRCKIPLELQQLTQWTVWKEIDNGDEKPKKLPIGKSDHPTTWISFDSAIWKYKQTESDYAGLMFALAEPYIGIDLDHCRCKETGLILDDWLPESRKKMEEAIRKKKKLPDEAPVALPTPKQIIEQFSETFQDISPSDTGVKIICRGMKNFKECRLGDIEIYSHKRFWTITGRGNQKQVTDQQQGIDWLHEALFAKPERSKETAEKIPTIGRNGDGATIPDLDIPENLQTIIEVGKIVSPKFEALYFTPPQPNEDQSAVDQSLISILAWLCGGKVTLIKELLFQSARKRDKWETHKTYLDISINRALEHCTEFFDWDSWREADLSREEWREVKQIYFDVKLQTAKEERTIPLDNYKPNTIPEGDMDVASIYVHLNHKNIKYVKEWKTWVTFKNGRWEIDKSFHANWMLQKTVDRLPEFMNRLPDDPKRKAEYKRFCRSYQAFHKRDGVMKTAREMPDITASSADFNTLPNLFNVQNGTINLISGKLQPHNRKDMLTQKCGTKFDPTAKCPEWLKFLDSVFAGDKELIDYIQTLCGYILWGNADEHILPVFWGTGANGKSTFVAALYYMLGTDYAARAPESLLVTRSQEVHPTQFKVLYQKRLAICAETGDGNRLDEARVKMLTGNDVICCRGMHQDFWEFEPTHTLILQTNYKPQIRGTDYGIWRRIKLIPFAVTYSPEQQDRELSAKLRNEASGILKWCVDGCKKWVEQGALIDPQKVQVATSDYQKQEDIVGQFLESYCIRGDSYCVLIGHLYDKFIEDSGLRYLTKQKFSKLLETHGIKRDEQRRKYLGIGMKTE